MDCGFQLNPSLMPSSSTLVACWRSIEHRATVNSEKERLSIATFYNPAINAIIGPAPSLVTPKTPAVFRRISAGENTSKDTLHKNSVGNHSLIALGFALKMIKALN